MVIFLALVLTHSKGGLDGVAFTSPSSGSSNLPVLCSDVFIISILLKVFTF